MRRQNKILLNAPAGNLPSLVAAVNAGADSVYIGFQSATNLRNLPGLNFSVEEAAEAVRYAHKHGVRVHVTVNTYPTDRQLKECFRAVDDANEIGADALIAADLAVLRYARTTHPHLEIHLSCVAGAADPASIRFYHEEFGISCIILPRILSLEQIATLRQQSDVLLEIMVFGTMCANYDGRCSLSSFITGVSAHSIGACVPAELVRFEDTKKGFTTVKINGINIDDFVTGQARTYPMPCKGNYYNPAIGHRLYAFADPQCLNALPLLPKIAAAGVDVVKIEGRQRSATYVQLVTSVWRNAINTLGQQEGFVYDKFQSEALESIQEGLSCSLGPLV